MGEEFPLVVKNVTRKFGDLVAVDDVSFRIREGEIVGLIGPNGAGKTTLYNIITGVYPPQSGKVIFKGEDITGKDPHEVAERGIGRSWQLIRMFEKLTVEENLLAAGTSIEKTEEKASELLELTELQEVAGEYPTSLSYGQRKLVEISRCLMSDADIVLLDEPAAGVNPKEEEKIFDVIGKMNEEGVGFMLVEHEMRLIMEHSDRVIALLSGEKIAEGPPKEVQNNEQLIETYFGGGKYE